MNSTTSKRKIVSICAGVACAALIGCGISARAFPNTNTVAYASTEETPEKIRVFIGDIGNAAEDYVQQRADYIERLASSRSNEMISAVVGFDDYYSVEEVSDFAEEYDINVDRVYMWPKGETGRLSISIGNGDIAESIETYKQYVEAEGLLDEQDIKDHQRFLNGEFEVFAVTVTASPVALETLNTEAECIRYVDVMHNDDAETYAAKKQKRVSYIELPSKPDGAL